MQIERFEIASRFRGPPSSGNGGYVCGRIAKRLHGTGAVRLKAPPPLNTEVRLESDIDSARLFHGTTLIGEAKRAELAVALKPAPAYEQAQIASCTFAGFKTHRFPGCFVCGPERSLGDGLRIFPGQVAESEVIASSWIPQACLEDENGMVATEFIWAALDCSSGFAVLPLPEGVAIVLGELCTSIMGTLSIEQPCVVTAWPLGGEGRKRFAASAVHTDQGRLIASARAVWVEVPSAAWGAT